MENTSSDWNYCERMGPEFWAEPINAITNFAFLIAAYVMWRRTQDAGLPIANALVAILAIIGVGSFLFHTMPAAWSGAADVLPILAFVLVYIHAANVHFWRMKTMYSAVILMLFFPYAVGVGLLVGGIEVIGSSAAYVPIALLIAAYAAMLTHKTPETAKNLSVGAALLVLSITFRAMDFPVCEALHTGTHFLWHILNAIMLGWMIETYRRHMVAEGDVGR